MPFHFVSFSLSGAIFVFGNYNLVLGGDGLPYPLDIICFSQPLDRYSQYKGSPYLKPSVLIQLSAPQLALLPLNYEGFRVERSTDGLTWLDISGVVSDSFFYIDYPPTNGVYYYRARMQAVGGVLSSGGNEVVVTVGELGNVDTLGVSEHETNNGALISQLQQNVPFPQGFDGIPHDGMSVVEGSLAGGYGAGTWYVQQKSEDIPPEAENFVPVCASINVPLPLTVITFSLRDYPYPGGSGIDDSKLSIRLSVTSQYSGNSIYVRQGITQPFSPLITCIVVPGVDPLLDRDVTITVPAGYIKTDDQVSVIVDMYDLDSNYKHSECTFTMEHLDIIPPEILYGTPICGSGISDENYVVRDTDVILTVTDSDSGVNITTVQIYYGSSLVGPWTQVVQNGNLFLGGFYGTIESILNGYRFTIKRPVNDPLWPPDAPICFRVVAYDVVGNMAEEFCCVKTKDEVILMRVVPIAEDVLFVEFTAPLLNDNALQKAENYQIVPIDSNSKLVTIRNVLPQQFSLPLETDQPFNRLGEGNPQFVYLNTTYHTHWGMYQLTVNNLRDQFNQPLKSTGLTAEYRARRTKVDEGRDSMDGDTSRSDSLNRRILISILHSDEDIGGVKIDDDEAER